MERLTLMGSRYFETNIYISVEVHVANGSVTGGLQRTSSQR